MTPDEMRVEAIRNLEGLGSAPKDISVALSWFQCHVAEFCERLDRHNELLRRIAVALEGKVLDDE